MLLRFYGANKAVTGSCHGIEVNGKKILVDCGLFQGSLDEYNDDMPFNPSDIDCLIVTHAHIDHTGRIPLLAKRGFKGKIYTTGLTAKLMAIMLRDSAHIQESEAEYNSRKNKRSGDKTVEPLYTMADAENALLLIDNYPYGQMIDICDGVRLRFTDAGHLLGSAIVELWVTENGVTRKLVFTGDLGNKEQAIIRDPQPVKEADFLLIESTYGDRYHDPADGEYSDALAEVIDNTLSKGGNVVIPSFAVGRTQELLYYIREIKERGLVKSVPNFQVWVDSPLAQEATDIFSGDLRGYMDEDAIKVVQKNKNMFVFPGLFMSRSVEESKALNIDGTPKVIISASGMCDAGRIRHHLKHNLWRSESTILFVGYQAEGTLGRYLLDGAKKVKMFGEEIAVRAQITNFNGLSAHADLDGLIEWVKNINPAPLQTFVTHGERESSEAFVETLKALGMPAYAPEYLSAYDLIAQKEVDAGRILEPKRVAEAKEQPAYLRLLAAGETLMAVVRKSRGMANKELAKFTDQILSLINKWER